MFDIGWQRYGHVSLFSTCTAHAFGLVLFFLAKEFKGPGRHGSAAGSEISRLKPNHCLIIFAKPFSCELLYHGVLQKNATMKESYKHFLEFQI